MRGSSCGAGRWEVEGRRLALLQGLPACPPVCMQRLCPCPAPTLHRCLLCFTQAKQQELSDANADVCVLCGIGGNLICCDACPAAYHVRCVGESYRAVGASSWFCPECRVGGRGEEAWRGWRARLWGRWQVMGRTGVACGPACGATHECCSFYAQSATPYLPNPASDCSVLQARPPACASLWPPATAGSSRCTSCTARWRAARPPPCAAAASTLWSWRTATVSAGRVCTLEQAAAVASAACMLCNSQPCALVPASTHPLCLRSSPVAAPVCSPRGLVPRGSCPEGAGGRHARQGHRRAAARHQLRRHR